MNLPNKLTLCRIILVPVFMIFVSLTEFGTETFNATWYLVAGIVFAAASFTDYLDGHPACGWSPPVRRTARSSRPICGAR